MAEISYYWDGTVAGDAISAPYTASLFTTNWKKLFTRADDEGIIKDYENELSVSGISGGVAIETGAALVEGYFYENTAQVTVTIPTPVTDPRIDRIVLHKDPILQTVRITRLAGTENPAPTAPAITQTAGGIFEIPLAQVLITVAGVITVTDERDYPWSPLIPTASGMTEIETIISDGTLTSFDFQSIPQRYNHLRIVSSQRGSISLSFGDVLLNGDSVAANYSKQDLGNNSPVVSLASITLSSALIALRTGMIANEPSGWTIDFPHYTGSFYKTILCRDTNTNTSITYALNMDCSMWKNTDAVTRISLPVTVGVYQSGSMATLFGLS